MIIEKVGLARQEVRRAGAAGAVVATGRQQPGARRAVGALTERPQRAGGQAMPGQLTAESFGMAKGKAVALCCLCLAPCLACVMDLLAHAWYHCPLDSVTPWSVPCLQV